MPLVSLPLPVDQPEPSLLRPECRSRRRRGTTAMEYLFMISLILVVLISGVNYFGQQTKKVAEDASNAIQNATNASLDSEK